MSEINAQIQTTARAWWFTSLTMCERVGFWRERRCCEDSAMFVRRIWIRENVEKFREVCGNG